jgi:hypothetical protein
MKNAILFVLIACLALLLASGVCPNTPPKGKTVGYRAVVGYGDGFVAVGTGGRIDRISAEGEVLHLISVGDITLNNLAFCGSTLMVAGDEGVLLIVPQGVEPRKIESGTTANIHSLALFKGKIVAGADGGTLLVGDEAGAFKVILLALKGDIVSVSGGDLGCYGVTDEGEIIRSYDLASWEILDFNEFYAGYYPPCKFTGVCVTDRQVAVIGQSEQGAVLALSTGGDVWTQRSLDYTDPEGMPATLRHTPRAIIYEAEWDRVLLACDEGHVMSVPACSHCNELYDLNTTSNLTALAENRGTVLVVGGEVMEELEGHTALPFRY